MTAGLTAPGWYSDAAAALDDHMATCPCCGSGTACSTGDFLADDEYRMWADLQATQPREDPSS